MPLKVLPEAQQARLSSNQLEIIGGKIRERIRLPCAACGARGFDVEHALLQLVPTSDPRIEPWPLAERSAVYAAVACQGCGLTLFFNVARLGLVDDPEMFPPEGLRMLTLVPEGDRA